MRKTSSMSLVHVSLREAYRQLEFIDFAMSLADVSLRSSTASTWR